MSYSVICIYIYIVIEIVRKFGWWIRVAENYARIMKRSRGSTGRRRKMTELNGFGDEMQNLSYTRKIGFQEELETWISNINTSKLNI